MPYGRTPLNKLSIEQHANILLHDRNSTPPCDNIFEDFVHFLEK